MMRARTVDQFEDALALNAMGNTNRVVADSGGRIARYYLAHMPSRNPQAEVDWTSVLPGDRSDLIWTAFETFDSLPHMIDPQAGYVLDANHSPFEVTLTDEDPDASSVPGWYGVETHMTNRALRATRLMAGLDTISREALLGVKYDNAFAPDSYAGQVQARIAAMDWSGESAQAAALIISWDRRTDLDNRAAALSVMATLKLFTATPEFDQLSEAEIRAAVTEAAALLRVHHGSIDPPWRAVNFLHRGGARVALAGAPDTLRAVNSAIDRDTGTLTMLSGDGLHMLAQWAPGEAYPQVFAMHQFGASNDPASPHYTDQMDDFAAERLRLVPMRVSDVRAAAVRTYRPGDSR